MASPQLENGFTRISNELLEQIIKANLNGTEWAVLMFIIRKTYGWNKKQDDISLSQFVNSIPVTKTSICKSLKNLQLVKIIKLVKKGSSVKSSNRYELCKNFESWQLVKKSKLVKFKKRTSKLLDNQLVKKSIHTKETITKDINTKEIISSQIENLLGQFTPNTQQFIKTYWDRARHKNKSRVITDGRRLTMITELFNAKERCGNLSTFKHALEMAVNYDAPNINYVNAVIKNCKTQRPR